VPGRSAPADVARIPALSLGWSGKCFGFDYNAATKTPTTLLNAFSSHFEDAALPMAARVAGFLAGKADVYRSETSVDPRTKGAVWVFNYAPAAPLYDPTLGMDVLINSVRDEVRQVAPGALLGRMYIKAPPPSDGGNSQQEYAPVPIFFWLGQTCMADGAYAVIPAARQLPLLSGGRR
jgi:hypothetical protein